MPNTLHRIRLKTALAGRIALASERTQAAVQRQQGSHHGTLDETPMLTSMLTMTGLPKAPRAGIAGHDAHG